MRPNETCLSCQYERQRNETGQWPSTTAFTHWSMWGCTCDPDTSSDALAYMDRMTR